MAAQLGPAETTLLLESPDPRERLAGERTVPTTAPATAVPWDAADLAPIPSYTPSARRVPAVDVWFDEDDPVPPYPGHAT